MTKHNNSAFLNGGEEMGMTNEQYKGILLDQLADLQRILKLVVKAGNTEAQEEVESQINKLNEKLKF